MEKSIIYTVALMLGLTTIAQARLYEAFYLWQDQNKREISKNELPAEVKSSFEQSDYHNLTLIAVYEIISQERATSWQEARTLNPNQGDYGQDPASEETPTAQEAPADLQTEFSDQQAEETSLETPESGMPDDQGVDSTENVYEIQAEGKHKRVRLIYAATGDLLDVYEEKI